MKEQQKTFLDQLNLERLALERELEEYKAKVRAEEGSLFQINQINKIYLHHSHWPSDK